MSVCDLETFLSICSKYNKSALITIRNEYIDELVESMMPLIYKYEMQDRCIINSNDLNSLETVKRFDESIRLSWIIKNGELTMEVVDKASDLGNCTLTLYSFWVENGGMEMLDSYEQEIIYAQEKGIPLYAEIVTEVSIVDQLKMRGISGAQFAVKVDPLR